MMLKMHEIRELIKLVDQSSLTEFEYEYEGMQLTLKKEAKVVQAAVTPLPMEQPQPAVTETTPSVPLQQPSANVASTSPEAQAEATAKPIPENLHQICSPMVGTFYAAPSPDADPYVTKGAKVSPTTVVCIVEAMKLMNEIEAEVRGEIVEILVENGQLVEYGQPLFLVKPE